MSSPLPVFNQTIASAGSLTTTSVAYVPRVVVGSSQSIAGAAAGTGGPVSADGCLSVVCTNPSSATPLTTPANAQLQLSLDNSTWVTVAEKVFNTVALATDSITWNLEFFAGVPSRYGLNGSTPIAWAWVQIVINGATGGSVVVSANQGTLEKD